MNARRMLLLSAGIVALAIVVHAQAGTLPGQGGTTEASSTKVQYFETGEKLIVDIAEWDKYRRREMEVNTVAVSYVQGYVSGVLDANGSTIATPDGFTIDQACAIVSKYLQENPQRLHLRGATLVREALLKAYPTRRG